MRGSPQAGSPELAGSFERLLWAIDRGIANVLDRALSGHEITVDEGEALFSASGPALYPLILAADDLRQRATGDTVTYVVNRNINFTNVCVKHCGFCAFSRTRRSEEGYFLPVEEVVRRAREAWELGATEVCVQAGLPPFMDGDLYPSLCRAIKRELPEIHIHGFSPEEVLYGSQRANCSIEDYLLRLKDAGVGSLPGTSAEILDDAVRKLISPGRISTADWIRVITSAHRLGIRTTSTIMYGHVETNRHRAAHLALLRDIQKNTGGFTEFVPLSFIHTEAPMYHDAVIPGIRSGASGDDVIRMHAIARIMLNGCLRNIQVSWVKEGLKLSQICLNAGANDMGGTLINESISTSAGAQEGQLVPPSAMRRAIRDCGRVPAERTSLYRIRREFSADGHDDRPGPLDEAASHPERFGSYFQLIADPRFRYQGP